jgi:hypothetical protein
MKDYPLPAQPLQGFDAEQLLSLFASHHQKMVLVNYEDSRMRWALSWGHALTTGRKP